MACSTAARSAARRIARVELRPRFVGVVDYRRSREIVVGIQVQARAFASIQCLHQRFLHALARSLP